MNLPKISIGIPVYNQAKTIKKAIESTLNQINLPFEIVVSENYSTDGTYEIVECFKESVRVVRPPKHLSMAENWNFCVNECKGDWVGLLSGDDILLPNYISAMQKGIQKDVNAVFVMGGWNVNDVKNNIIEAHYLLSIPTILRYPKTTEKLLTGTKASFAAFCFKKEKFNEVGGYDESFHYIQDWIFQFDMSFKGSFVNIKEIVAEYLIDDRVDLDTKRFPFFVDDTISYLSTKIWNAQSSGIPLNCIIKSGKVVFINLLYAINDYKYNLNITQLSNIENFVDKFMCGEIYKNWLNTKALPKKENQLKVIGKKIIRKIYSHLKNK